MSERPIIVRVFSTQLGAMGIAAQADGVVHRIWFDYDCAADLLAAIRVHSRTLPQSSEALEFKDTAHADLVRRLKKFAQGQVDTFADIALDLSWATPFQRHVIERARKIPRGQTLSYGRLAEPSAARAVGSVMAKNRFPLIVPCHRVVASGKHLGGFSSPHGLSTKERLLELEGALNEKGALIN
jgi:methylated-DNA-[protein]-cysteine S-methyltransferase